MARFLDLQPLTYFGDIAAKSVRAIAWLERGDDFLTGQTDPKVYDRLKSLLEEPFTPFVSCGHHGCTLCTFAPEAHGSRNLFVPGDGFLYVCPELILHYMNAHAYSPPDEFCRAVLACPDQRTPEFRKLFLAGGGRDLLAGMHGQTM